LINSYSKVTSNGARWGPEGPRTTQSRDKFFINDGIEVQCTICTVMQIILDIFPISLAAKCGGIVEAASESEIQFWAWQSTKQDRTTPVKNPCYANVQQQTINDNK